MEQGTVVAGWDYAFPMNNADGGLTARTAAVIAVLVCPSDRIAENPILASGRYYGMTSYGGNGGTPFLQPRLRHRGRDLPHHRSPRRSPCHSAAGEYRRRFGRHLEHPALWRAEPRRRILRDVYRGRLDRIAPLSGHVGGPGRAKADRRRDDERPRPNQTTGCPWTSTTADGPAHRLAPRPISRHTTTCAFAPGAAATPAGRTSPWPTARYGYWPSPLAIDVLRALSTRTGGEVAMP